MRTNVRCQSYVRTNVRLRQFLLVVVLLDARKTWLWGRRLMWVWIVLLGGAVVLWLALRKRDAGRPNPANISEERASYLGREQVGDHVASSKPVSSIASQARAAGPTVSVVDVGGRYRLVYGDVDGVVTEREISVRRAAADYGRVYLLAFCHLRQAERTFRADRVLELTAVPSLGPVHSPSAAIADLARRLAKPDPDHAKVMARVRGGLRPIIWIARSDREISSDEASIILDFIAERSALNKSSSPAEWDRALAALFIDEARPTYADAVGALAKMAPGGREAPLVDAYAQKIVECGGSGAERRYRQLFGSKGAL